MRLRRAGRPLAGERGACIFTIPRRWTNGSRARLFSAWLATNRVNSCALLGEVITYCDGRSLSIGEAGASADADGPVSALNKQRRARSLLGQVRLFMRNERPRRTCNSCQSKLNTLSAVQTLNDNARRCIELKISFITL